jgi:hypothetical protein
MKRRKGLPNFAQSESEFLISYLDRHESWAVIVCLVGGGQEIHTGEAGIAAWLEAVSRAFPHWRTYVSPDLSSTEYDAQSAVEALAVGDRLVRDARLHLATSMRSFRSERVSAFVKALLDGDERRGGLLQSEPSCRAICGSCVRAPRVEGFALFGAGQRSCRTIRNSRPPPQMAITMAVDSSTSTMAVLLTRTKAKTAPRLGLRIPS